VWFPSVADPNVAGRVDFLVPDTREKHLKESNPDPPASAKKAIIDLGATTTQLSSWSKPWALPRLDSTTGFHMGSADCKAHKDFWIEAKFAQSSDVYQVILKRRADNDKP